MQPNIDDPSYTEIPRCPEPRNPYNYTELEKAKKALAIKDAVRDYPRLPEKWIEWMYDTIENKPKEEVDRIINEKLWEKPIKPDRMTGGTIKGALEVLPPPEKELVKT